jgi:hypothetical protein
VFKFSPTKKSIKINFCTENFELIPQPFPYQELIYTTLLVLQKPSKIHSMLTDVIQMNNSHSNLRYTMYFACKRRKQSKLICAIIVQPYLIKVSFSTLLCWLQSVQHHAREGFMVAKSGVPMVLNIQKHFM